MSEEIESTAVELAEPVENGHPSPTLFRSDDPATVLQRAQATAEALMPVVREKGLISKIQGKDFLRVEGWQTLGAMLGVTPICTWTRKIDDGWEARVEARTLDGRVIGAAEAECLKAEENWKDSEDYAVRSMAQTRATSKALASVLRFVATLAGLEGTPAEEMDGVKRGADRKGFVVKADGSSPQRTFFERLLKGAGMKPDAVVEVVAYAQEALSGERDGPISKAIDALKESSTKREAAERLLAEAREHHAKQSDVPIDTEGLPDAA